MLIRRRGFTEKGRKKRYINKGRPEHRSLSVRGVGCEGLEKIWMEVWCGVPQHWTGRRGLGLVQSSHDRKGRHPLWAVGRIRPPICCVPYEATKRVSR